MIKDWDPSHSALANGNGTPWGPEDTGRPDNPNYITDPRQLDEQFKSQRAGMAAGAGRTTQAMLARFGVGGGEATRAAGRASADVESNVYDKELGWMHALNEAKKAKYDQDYGAWQTEEKGRGDFYNKALKAGGAAVGSFI